MTAMSQAELDPRDAQVRDLTWELACCSGALSEIATCWRRSQSLMPDLPPGLPLRLQDSASQIGEDARSLADTGRGQVPGSAAELAQRFAAFRQDFAFARDMTSSPWSAAHAGDALLWDSADAALNRAGDHLRLIVEQVSVTDQSPAPPPGRVSGGGAGDVPSSI